jgi:hypothetical protein
MPQAKAVDTVYCILSCPSGYFPDGYVEIDPPALEVHLADRAGCFDHCLRRFIDFDTPLQKL